MSAFFSRLLFVSLTSVLVLILGCSNPTKVTTPPLRTGAGVALLKILATPDSPFSRIADSATVTVSASDMITFTTALTVTDSSITGTITGIPAGTNRLFYVAVYDSYDTLQYRGSATANVFADSSVTLSLSITRVSGAAIVNGVITDGDVISTRGLVAYYPFNGGAKDVSGNGYNGVVNGAVLTTDRFGRSSSAYAFNGITDYIQIPASSKLNITNNSLSISLWFKADLLAKSLPQSLLWRGDNQSGRDPYFISTTSDTILFGKYAGNGTTAEDRRAIVAKIKNSWTHVSAVFDYTLNNYSLFLDGVLIKDTSMASSEITYATDQFWNTIGGLGPNTGGWGQYFAGNIDDIRLYSRALSASEINTLYHEEGWNNTVSDIDGNEYHTVTIGTQTWMVENLKTTRYNDGTAIPLVTDNTAWSALTTPGYCYYNNDSNTYKSTYGALYNWHAVNTGKLAPAGWHVPTDSEWTVLTTYLGGTSVAGGKLKETGTTHWTSPNVDATNQFGFTALPGGYRAFDGPFSLNGASGGFWTATIKDTSNAWLRGLSYTYALIDPNPNKLASGFSVRLIKGSSPISGFATDSSTVGLWRFNEGSGTTFASAIGGSGTLYGGVTWSDGRFGKALKLNGTDAYGICNIDPPENNCTYEMWFKPDAALSSQGGALWIGCMSFNAGPSISLDSVSFAEFSPGYPHRTPYVFSPNQWYYIALTISSNSSQQAFYINGQQVSLLTAGNKASFNWTSLLIGVSSGFACTNLSHYFNGYIDEFRVSNRVRTAAEIQAAWVAGGGQ